MGAEIKGGRAINPAMHPRAVELIRLLELQPHPEGGFYRRIHRSEGRVLRQTDGSERQALTSIYYLLTAGEVSRWHRVLADEAWHHYEGAPLDLFSFAADGGSAATHQLGPLQAGASPVHVVPAGWWQAARPFGDYALVGCTVGPGFEFEDFTLLADLPAADRPSAPNLADFDLFL
jgi:predicted cupin superfamily sugar epimerase